MASLPIKRFTPEEYLAIERAAESKSEYISGEIIAMAGASWKHGLIKSNVEASLRSGLQGKPCRAMSSDLRVQAGSSYLYPDVVVACGKAQFHDDANLDTLLNPTVIVEVLSKSTESEDRGIKFMRYGMISTLKEYILVSQDQQRIEHFYRDADGIWERGRIVTESDDALLVESINCSLSIKEVYEEVDSTE